MSCRRIYDMLKGRDMLSGMYDMHAYFHTNTESCCFQDIKTIPTEGFTAWDQIVVDKGDITVQV